MARQMRRAMTPPAAPAARRSVGRTMVRTELARQGRGITQFIGEVRSELRKVVWPTRREAANLTLLVIALSSAVGFLLGGIDFLFQQLFRLIVGA